MDVKAARCSFCQTWLPGHWQCCDLGTAARNHRRNLTWIIWTCDIQIIVMLASKHCLALPVQVYQNESLLYNPESPAAQHTASQLTAPLLPHQCLIPFNLKLIIIPWARVNLTYTWHLSSWQYILYTYMYMYKYYNALYYVLWRTLSFLFPYQAL